MSNAKPDLTMKARFGRSDKEGIVGIYNNEDNLTCYENPCVEGATPPSIQDNAGTVRQHPVTMSSEKRNPFIAAAVCLGLLCLLLLAGIIGLGIYSSANETKWNKERADLTKERDTLRQSYSNITEERDQLKNRSDNLARERDQLKNLSDNLARERDQLEMSQNLVMEKICDLQIDLYELTDTECPGGWVKFGCSCYYISTEAKTWHQSREDCQSGGADLVIINNSVEQAFITRFQFQFWIGLSDQETERTWKWVDGSSLTNNGFWTKGEPNQSGSEDCVEFVPEWNGWNDMSCLGLRRFICENDVHPSTPLSIGK